MKRSNLNNREQLLSALVIVAIVAGAYGLLRYRAVDERIEHLQKSTESMQKRLLKARIPDEPLENVEGLTAQLDDLERAMALVRDQAELMELRLAPFDSQELKVRISQLARDSGVRIRSNEKLQPPPQTKNDQKSKRAGKKRGKTAAKPTEPLILPETSGWVVRMSPGTMFHRPMQQIELEGSFMGIRKFIHGLDDLSYQVTVLQLNIEKLPLASPAGYPQALLAKLVLAL
ncbi:hypothetical protein Q9L42_008480 [Methylomarinum sp. Ch1-1]|uniref:Uncharacterized protein n=1 Tax=Methylomarinum roseum TaxID=3067653 RepID=A0AAU7NYW6_9GAMM|nr:hypothetical protein [Methylomarinum sp. Ch1-1]MDP4521736.1 hypothetical protein [Methylomarinum sp. Ch1-1]